MMLIGTSSSKKARSRLRDVTVLTLSLFTMLAFPSVCLRADENSQKVAGAAKLAQEGKLDQAETLVWGVLTLHPDDAPALSLLGKIRLQQKRFTEAETLLRRANTLAPDLLSASMNLAQVFRAEAETDKEIAAWLDAQRLAPNNAEVNCGLAVAYLKGNHYERALDSLQKIPRTHYPDAAFPLLAASYLGLGRVAEAGSLIPTVSARAAKDPAIRVDFAEVLLDFDLTNDALALLETAEKQQHPTAELFFALGRARERKGELALAQKDFQQALQLDPSSLKALQASARLLAGQGQWEKSLELLRRARASDPNSPEVLRKFAATSLHAGHSADAVEAAQQLVRLRPTEPEALYLLGVAQLQSGDAQGAHTTLEGYTKLRPEDALAFLALGMADNGLQDFTEARVNLEQSIKLDPNQAEPYYQLALISRDQGDTPVAIAQLEKAVAVNNRYAEAHAVLGTLYLLQQEYPKAQEHLTRAADLAPNTPDTHYQLGLLFARLNQRDRAQREMEQFRKLKDKGHSNPSPDGDRPATSPSQYPPS